MEKLLSINIVRRVAIKKEKKKIIQEKRKREEKMARECKGKREDWEGEWSGGRNNQGRKESKGEERREKGGKGEKREGGKGKKERGMERWNGREEEDGEKEGGRRGKWEEKEGDIEKGKGKGIGHRNRRKE